MSTPHHSVMLKEVLEYLSPKEGEIYVDGTFGAGGYSKACLAEAGCTVYGIDRDPSVKRYADALAQTYGDRLHLLEGRYSEMDSLLNAQGIQGVHGVMLDIGVSSMQIDQAERGFSFMRDGVLDMRMESQGVDAATLVNETGEQELADMIFRYGDERKSRRIAKAIVEARKTEPITRTVQLAEIIRKAVGRYHDAIDPATRTFQALRIWVNDELGELERGLEAAERLLLPGGRLVVVTFHSLEDGIVKEFLKNHSAKRVHVSRYAKEKPEVTQPFEVITRKAVQPGPEETKANPRSRSAKLRAARRTEWQ
jgi:16S rRNA (cytosine1402-N4)-methyltransferase